MFYKQYYKLSTDRLISKIHLGIIGKSTILYMPYIELDILKLVIIFT